MNIDEVARATRRHHVSYNGDIALTADVVRRDRAEAQAACDRMNLRAVLEAIREPSVEMYRAGVDAALGSLPEKTFRAMIDALLADVKAR